MKSLIILFLVYGCASKQKLSDIAKEDERFKLNTFAIKDESEAATRIQNRLTYLKLLFEQSRDHYFETPKWEEHCFQDNRPGKLERNGKIIYSVSRLYFDSRKIEGFCSDKPYAYPGYSVDVFCPDEKFLRQYKFMNFSSIDWKKVDLCR